MTPTFGRSRTNASVHHETSDGPEARGGKRATRGAVMRDNRAADEDVVGWPRGYDDMPFVWLMDGGRAVQCMSLGSLDFFC